MNCKDNKVETVEHYLLKCNKYNNIRIEMYNELARFDAKLNINKNHTLKNLLFPHLTQKKPAKKDNIMNRVERLKIICKFVIKSKRFFNNNVKTKAFKQLRNEIKEEDDRLYLELMKKRRDKKSETIVKQIEGFIDNIDFYDSNFDINLNSLIQNIEKLNEKSNNNILNEIINNKNKIYDSND